MEGILLSGIGGLYTVLCDGVQYKLRAQAKIRRRRLTPLPGDRVLFTPGHADEDGWLEELMPRKNCFVRPAAANLDVICLCVSAAAPQADLLLLDRMLLQCAMNGVESVIVITKCDADEGFCAQARAQYEMCGARVVAVSAADGTGVEALKAILKGRIHAMAGQSGVGKSSLSQRIDRGRNTTRHSALIPLEDGGMALDTPGFSLFDLEVMDPLELTRHTPEFVPYEGRCRFSPCTHRKEPGCAVLADVDLGLLPRERWMRYCTLFDDMDIKWRNRYD